jgi:hypothetical protein
LEVLKEKLMKILLPMGIQQSDREWTKEVELEEMTGEEEDILSDATRLPGGGGILAKKTPERVTEILSRCTKSIGKESRPSGKDRFTAPKYFEPHWNKAFTHDRGFAIVRLRQLSLGDEYLFEDECPGCGKSLKRVSVDLSSLKMTSVDLDKFRGTDGIYTTRLPKGSEVRWRILRGEDEPAISLIQESRKADLISALLFTRLVSIDGQTPRFEDLRRMSSKDRTILRTSFAPLEGGLETELTIVCDNPGCQRVFERTLNPGRLDFFFPSEISADSKETSSA